MREAACLSVPELARRAGVAANTIRRIESDPDYTPREATVRALALVLDPETPPTPAGGVRRPASNGPQLLRVAEVARRLHCGRTHAYDLINGGFLKTVDIGIKGPAIRVLESELNDYIARRTTGAKRTTGTA